jgi:hypothetical protein
VKGLAIAIVCFLAFVGCETAPKPLEEYTLARAAIEAARSVQAPRHSPGFWHQADEAYRQGRLSFKDREYGRAREEFVRARIAAEKAENSARLIRQKTGDVL